jgi:hypothetical protein
MTQMVGLNISQMTAVDAALFWRMVDWCHREGATEFTLSVFGYNGYEAARNRFEQIKELLEPYERPSAKRLKPVNFMWEEDEDTSLWALTEDSILELKRTVLKGIFGLKGTRRTKAAKFVEVGNLCLYREGEPMLAVLKEQGLELNVILKPEEIKLFRQDHLEIMGSYDPKDLFK